MTQPSDTPKIRVGISVGDINGVGMEVIMKTFADKRILDFCTPVVFGSSKVASYHRKALDMLEFNFHVIHNLSELHDHKPNLINCWKEEVNIELGKETPEGGKYAFISLEHACKALKDGEVDVLLTAPINKHNIQSDDFKFAGHTEYLENYFGGKSLMLLVNEGLRMGLVTGHVPIAEVAKNISTEKILDKLEVLNTSLKQDFAIRKPKIAILGLNPHNGDNGIIGEEDSTIIKPAVEAANEKGILVRGPYAADGFFGSEGYREFDAVLAMYHDQGLVPFKTLSFNNGVNFTAGLPVIRTSPDHGTGYGIAGKNEASESSFRQALYMAIDLYKNRNEYKGLTANPLRFSKGRKDS